MCDPAFKRLAVIGCSPGCLVVVAVILLEANATAKGEEKRGLSHPQAESRSALRTSRYILLVRACRG